jgi:hypothetical protein
MILKSQFVRIRTGTDQRLGGPPTGTRNAFFGCQLDLPSN